MSAVYFVLFTINCVMSTVPTTAHVQDYEQRPGVCALALAYAQKLLLYALDS